MSGAAEFALSLNGTLVDDPAQPGPSASSSGWTGRTTRRRSSTRRTTTGCPACPPTEARLAVGIGSDIWVFELARSTRTRVTHGTTSMLFPFAWSRDGTPDHRSARSKTRSGLDLYTDAADGSGQPELLLRGDHRQWATSSSPTSDAVAVYEQHPTTLRDIWTGHPDGNASTFLASPYQERAARFSPDGKWIAYVSNDSGRDEVYVLPASGGGEKTTVSTEGGIEPVWAASGREMFYRNGDRLDGRRRSRLSPALRIGRPQLLFSRPTSGIAVLASPTRTTTSLATASGSS